MTPPAAPPLPPPPLPPAAPAAAAAPPAPPSILRGSSRARPRPPRPTRRRAGTVGRSAVGFAARARTEHRPRPPARRDDTTRASLLSIFLRPLPPRPSEPHHITRLGLTCSLWRGRVRQRALWWLGGAGRAVCASAPRASHASCITAALNSGHGSKQQGRRGRHHRRRGRVRLRRVSAARPAFRCSRTRPTTHGRPQHA